MSGPLGGSELCHTRRWHYYPRIMKLFDDVHLIECPVGGRPLRLPLLVGEWHSLLMDTGCASDVPTSILPFLSQAGLPLPRLTYVLNTHCDTDHIGGNHAIKQAAPQARLCCGDADREQIESPTAIYRQRYDAYRTHGIFYDEATHREMLSALGEAQPVDLTFMGGERLRLGPDWEIQIVHLPGHSHGHLGVLDLKHRALYGGDAIHGSVYLSLNGRPALCPTYLYVEAYLQTIRFIEHLDIDLYCGCHWPVKRGAEIGEFCAESRDFVQRAERFLLEALAEPKTLRALCGELGPKLGGWPEPVHRELAWALSGHLAKLEGEGVVDQLPNQQPPVFERTKH